MELCTSRSLSTSSLHHPQFSINSSISHFNPLLPFKNRVYFSGIHSNRSTLLRATSDETSGGASKFSWDKSDPVATIEDVPSGDDGVRLDNVSPVNQNMYNENKKPEQPGDESASSETMQSFNELLENLNIKLDSEDSYLIFIYGGGALVALWFLSAIVGAIDSIPVFPKLMEVVGLGYSLWFTTRYLLFKNNREELFSKIEDLKREVLGSGDN